jgi:DNA topoisomerase-2
MIGYTNDKNGKKGSEYLVEYRKTEKSSDCKVGFELKFKAGVLNELVDKGILEKELKLVESRNTNLGNMHLFDADGKIKKYENALEILDDFYDVRLDLYIKRKAHIEELLEKELILLDSRVKFVLGVINDEIQIFHKEDSEIDAILEGYLLPKIEESYGYLTAMPIRSLTKKKVEELRKQLDEKNAEYLELKGKTVIDLWNEDLDNFVKQYEHDMESYMKEISDVGGIVGKVCKKKSKK